MSNIAVPDFKKEDYTDSTAPFEWLYQYKDDKFVMAQALTKVKEKAGQVGVKNFITLWKAYLATVQATKVMPAGNVTDFTGQPIELNCGEWLADDYGIAGIDSYGREIQVCSHPIMPIQRLVNVDTDAEKLILAYKKRGGAWRTITVDKKTIASAKNIVELSELGIAVTSENARAMVRYLADVENLNIETIPETNSVGRLGWIGEHGFSPYVDNLIFDGDIQFKHFFNSVKEFGDFEVWKNAIQQAREFNTITRLYIAASFASVLVKFVDGLPFFVHLWGGTESGKSVALMAAASVWANPNMGEYIHSFNSTSVGHELSATFVNNLPLMIDELQIVGDRRGFDELIYKLSEGVGKTRGNTAGGLRKVGTWRNCILTNGEKPITNINSGGGAVNRIIEIDCKDQKLIDTPMEFLSTIRKNYGFAGRMFVERLQTEDGEALSMQLYKINYLGLISDGEITEKQAMAASILLTADALADEWIFHSKNHLKQADIKPFLATKRSVSVNIRALEYLYDYVNINMAKFTPSSDYTGEIWGVTDMEYIYIIKSQFDKILTNEGYSPEAFLSWANSNGVIETGYGRNTKTKRINGEVSRCVWIKKGHDTLMEEGTSDYGFPF